jgi:predicted amidophosphoribosyltransferase
MLGALRDLLWPSVCPVCERECEPDEQVHGNCLTRIAQSRYPGVSPVPVFSCWEDGPEWFRILHQWKYGGESALAEIVAREMARHAPPGLRDAVLVPMPDDPARWLERGFSPVGDLTAALAKRTQAGLDASLLRRRRSRASQTSCADDAARLLNITGILRTGELARWPRTTRLVLVDDQVTSGATIRAAVSRLRARGNPVWVWCAARAARAPEGLS